jgi:hypothetical protein
MGNALYREKLFAPFHLNPFQRYMRFRAVEGDTKSRRSLTCKGR